MALGALHQDVLSLIIRQAMWLVVIGEGIGVIAALALTPCSSDPAIRRESGDLWIAAAAMAVLTLVAPLRPMYRRGVRPKSIPWSRCATNRTHDE